MRVCGIEKILFLTDNREERAGNEKSIMSAMTAETKPEGLGWSVMGRERVSSEEERKLAGDQ